MRETQEKIRVFAYNPRCPGAVVRKKLRDLIHEERMHRRREPSP